MPRRVPAVLALACALLAPGAIPAAAESGSHSPEPYPPPPASFDPATVPTSGPTASPSQAASAAPSPIVYGPFAGGPSADIWTLAHDATGRAWVRRFDGTTGRPVSTKGIDVPGCTWRSVSATTTEGVWVTGAPVYTPFLDTDRTTRLGSVCFAFVPFAGGPPAVSRIWVGPEDYTRIAKVTTDGGSLWAFIDGGRQANRGAIWRIDPGAPPARILAGVGDAVAAGGRLWLTIDDRPYRFDPSTGVLERLRLGCGNSGCGIGSLRVDASTAGVVFQGQDREGPGIRGQIVDLVRGWTFSDFAAGRREGIVRTVSPLLLTRTSVWGVSEGDLVAANVATDGHGSYRLAIVARCGECRYRLLGVTSAGVWVAHDLPHEATMELWDRVTLKRIATVDTDPYVPVAP